ncbi:hypothetical protein IV503_18290 [Klebsiella huaxiensis]|uniref:fimbrial protein n=1 Tax=Klebsiella huaxiensis TaxID=2153354 RepID=UPI002F314AEF
MNRQTINALLVTLTVPLPVGAINISEDVYWYDGDTAGQKAATCLFHIPDKKPFADAVTLVTDKSQSPGTVLWSWDYATFLPDYTLSCVGSGISNSSGRLKDPARGNPSGWQLRVTAQGGTDLMPTTNPGVGIRWYFHSAQGEQVKTQAQLSATASLDVSMNSDGRYVFNPGKVATLSAKAELVKTGEVAYGTAISPQPAQSQIWLEAGTTQSRLEETGHGGIIPVAPSCRLATKEYQVEMGRWVTQNGRQLPARGAETPFELQLECTGQVEHLRLRFEDSGTRASANQNITLYRAKGGDSISGLELEMLFNGNRINIGDTETLDIGSRGRSTRNDVAIFQPTAPISLTARYLQYANITSDASTYTGNINGKVNIWMSYD